MIEISVADGEIRISGHARAAPRGSDIVCAAISMAFQTLIASLERLTDDKISYSLQPGKARLTYTGLSASGRVCLESFFIGAGEVADAYPDCVRIITQTDGRRGTEAAGAADKATASREGLEGGFYEQD